MAKLFDNDDDDFDFTPSTSSNLSSLFESFTSPQSADSSTNLKYKAPKQPKIIYGNNDDVHSIKDKKPDIQEKSNSSVILAKAITLWKVDLNKRTSNVGKHAIAIIGSTTQNQFEAIIYKEKHNILIRKALNENTIFYEYNNNFMSFYDNQNQFWSISFENRNDLEMFLSEIIKIKGTIIDKTNKTTSTPHSAGIEESKINLNKRENAVQPNLDIDNNNSDSSLSKTKADILTRITKMGQQILPENPNLRANTSTELSDSDIEENRFKKPVTTPRKLKKSPQKASQSNTPSSQPENTSNNSMWVPPQNYNNKTPQVFPNINQNQVALGATNLSPYPQNILYSQPIHDYGYTSLLLTQNSELKANLNEINSKLNSVLNGNTNTHSAEENRALKSKIKVLNLKVDNLKGDLEKSEKRYEKLKQELDMKCEEIMQKERNFQSYEEDRLKMNEYCEKSKSMENIISDLNDELARKDTIIEEKLNKIKDLEDSTIEYEKQKKEFLEEIESLNNKIAELQNSIQKLEKSSASTNLQQLNLKQIEKNVRKNMNDTFVQIMEHFQEDENYSSKEIQSIVLKNLKRTSFNILDAIKDSNIETLE